MEALQQVRTFITTCTKSRLPEETYIEVVAGEGIPDQFSARLTEKLSIDLGKPRERSLGGTDTAYRWPIAPSQLDTHTQLIESLCPLPSHTYRLQPIAVTAFFKFHLLAPNSDLPLPDQGAENYGGYSPGYSQLLGESHLYARISERSSASLFLNFPGEPDTSLAEAATQVQANLPFKLSALHWKRWQLTKSGKSYVGRKTSTPLARA